MNTYVKTVGNLSGLTNKSIRKAVRAIMLRDNQILLIRTSKGDLKFPGGGVEADESFSQALCREVQEETGYQHIQCNEENIFCIYSERSVDQFELNTEYESQSYYIFAELLDEDVTALKLDDYERELQFQAEWIDLKESILQNTHALLSHPQPNPWVERELIILKDLWRHKRDMNFLK